MTIFVRVKFAWNTIPIPMGFALCWPLSASENRL